MPSPDELQAKFWKALKSDKTMMLGLQGIEDASARPMTAHLDGERNPIWFFAARDNDLVRNLNGAQNAIATFTSNGHDLFATLHGRLSLDNNHATIDRLWNSFVAAWFDGGKDDPRLALLRLDADTAEIWESASSLAAGIKMALGADLKQEYKDNVANVTLR